MLTAAKTVHFAQIATTRARLRALVDEIVAIRPILVPRGPRFTSSNLLDSMFMHHSLAPDK
jgi:hypothetical protein